VNRRPLAGSATTIAAMPSLPKSKPLAALVAVTALLALPAAAQATLAYVKNPMKPVVYAANDDGSGAFKVGSGNNPKVSPDGDVIAYSREGNGGKRGLVLGAATAGGGSTPVLGNLQDSFYVTFSPDSKLVAAVQGPEIGKGKLVLLDVTSGTLLRKVASGYFSGISFSPDGTELAYSVSQSEDFPAKTDVFTATVAAGKPTQITKGGNSVDPLWGPSKIVFARQLGAKSRKYGPKNELFLMNPNGSGQKQLTHTKVDQLLQGLYPTEWSANGKRLLAEFEGQDTSYAVTVNPKTGAQKPLDKMGDGEQGFVGTSLSKDGSTVLGFTGGFEPGPNHAVATIPYSGGKAKTLVENAFEPDWSR
jgi:Tol biopolymer transport system component